MAFNQYINLNSLVSHSQNRELNTAHIHDLADPILLNGLLQMPVVSLNEDDTYTILSGHHRIAACRLLVKEGYSQFQVIECQIVEKDDLQKELILIDSNLQFKELSVYETMLSIGRKEEILRELKKWYSDSRKTS